MFNEITLETYNAQLDCLLALQDNLMKEYYMEMYFLEQENPQQSGDNVEGKSGTTTVTTDKSTAESNAKDGQSFSDKAKRLAEKMSQWVSKMANFVAQSVQKAFLLPKIQKIVNMQYVKMSTKNNLFEWCVEGIKNWKKNKLPVCTKVDKSFQPGTNNLPELCAYNKEVDYKKKLDEYQNDTKDEMAMFQKGDQEKVYVKRSVDTFMSFLYGRVLQVQAIMKKTDEFFKNAKSKLSEEELNNPNYQSYTKYATTWMQNQTKIFQQCLSVCNEMMKALEDASKKTNGDNKDQNNQNQQDVAVKTDATGIDTNNVPTQ